MKTHSHRGAQFKETGRPDRQDSRGKQSRGAAGRMPPVGSIGAEWRGLAVVQCPLLRGTLQGGAGLVWGAGGAASLRSRGRAGRVPGRPRSRSDGPGPHRPLAWVRTAVLPSDTTPRMPSEGSGHQGRVQERARGRARRDLAACPASGDSESASPACPQLQACSRPACALRLGSCWGLGTEPWPGRRAPHPGLPARSALRSAGSKAASAVPTAGSLLLRPVPSPPAPL